MLNPSVSVFHSRPPYPLPLYGTRAWGTKVDTLNELAMAMQSSSFAASSMPSTSTISNLVFDPADYVGQALPTLIVAWAGLRGERRTCLQGLPRSTRDEYAGRGGQRLPDRRIHRQPSLSPGLVEAVGAVGDGLLHKGSCEVLSAYRRRLDIGGFSRRPPRRLLGSLTSLEPQRRCTRWRSAQSDITHRLDLTG